MQLAAARTGTAGQFAGGVVRYRTWRRRQWLVQGLWHHQLQSRCGDFRRCIRSGPCRDGCHAKGDAALVAETALLARGDHSEPRWTPQNDSAYRPGVDFPVDYAHANFYIGSEALIGWLVVFSSALILHRSQNTPSMPDTPPPDERLTQCANLWLQVCRARGTPAPDQTLVGPFLASLPALQQSELERALLLCLNGREKHRELALVSWAAACTRPDFLIRVQGHGLGCSGPALFGAGLTLMASGWDMSARIAQLAGNPQDIAALAVLLGQPVPAPEPQPEVPVPPIKPGRLKRQGLAPVQHIFAQEETLESVFPIADDLDPGALSLPGRLQVRLLGRESAHTLEIGPHRRSASFMGVHVVTIESAHALLDASGYDWDNKLTLQLTPEEMPLATAVLMNRSASARFGRDGAERGKFAELRHQENGLVLVTGQGSAVHAVPVKAGALYYLLSLFCRGMARGLPGSSVAEVLALMEAASR